MAVASVCHQTLCLIQSLVKRLSLVHSQYRRQFLMGKLFADIHRLNFANQNLGILRNLNACQLGNGCRLLSHNLGVQGAVYNDGLADLINLARL